MEDISKQFYLNGCMQGEWAETESYDKVMKSLKTIFNNDLNDGFELKQKYQYSEDLRPNVYDYDESFINILFENNIHKMIENVVSANVELAHIQIRNVYPYPDGKSSYQMWHRDSHNYNNNPHGNFPPGYKIIFYPTFGGETENVLSIIPGSHIRMFFDEQEDRKQITPENIITISNSDTKFILFNVGLFHSTEPVREKNQRIIYNFVHKSQLGRYDEKCIELWREGCKRYV